MPHRIDIDSIRQNLFVLMHLAYGAEHFAKKHDLEAVDEENGPINRGYYEGWLKYTLSEKLLEVSVKTRVILDIVGAEEKRYAEDGEAYSVDLAALDKEISEKHSIAGSSTGGKVTLRECCNKVIHAAEIHPIFHASDDEHENDEELESKRELTYWSGSLDMSGTHHYGDWHYQLEIPEFCAGLEELLSVLEAEVDWYSIHQD